MSPPDIVSLGVGGTVIGAALLRLAHSIYRFTRSQETTQTRLAAVEAQLKNNGGDSARDMLDKIHAGIVDNAEAVEENAQAVEEVREAQRRTAVVVGEAARAAATAQQEATDARRGVNALRASVDVMMDAALRDHAGLWDAIAQIDPALDRRRGDRADPET